MGVKRFEELACWQLADALKREVYAVTNNIAEGFGRFSPAEFARFLQIARGSLSETQNHLKDAMDRHLISDTEHLALHLLANRAIGATTNLIRYLKSRDAVEFGRAPRREP